MVGDAVVVLTNYAVVQPIYMSFPEVDIELLMGNLQGYNLGRYILAWAQTLKWPPPQEGLQSETDTMVATWGISWFELYINFYVITKQRCPVRIDGTLADTTFGDLYSPEVQILPLAKRSGMVQCTAFQAAVRCVESPKAPLLKKTNSY